VLQKHSDQDTRNTLGKEIVKRELVEISHVWICSECRYQFYNLGCILDGLTLNEIIQHVKKMREQAFAKHVCQLHTLGATT
jgi:ribosomal protein L37AE/L43A